jgi:hypothetical protein
MMKFLIALVAVFTPVAAFAQSAGTMALPTGVKTVSPLVLQTQFNAQLTSKFDYAAAGPLASQAGSSPSAAISAGGGILTSQIGQPNGVAPLTASGGLQLPTATVLGGVLSSTAGTNQFMTGITTSGVPTYVQPSFGNLSGSASISQLPVATTSTVGIVSASTGLGISAGTLSVNYGATSTTALQGNDSRLSNLCLTTGCVMTGALTPSTTYGIVGTTAGNNANAGSVGEFLSASSGSSGAVTMTSSTFTVLTSLTLTPGDWYVNGIIGMYCSTSQGNNMLGGISTSTTVEVANQYFQNYQTTNGLGTFINAMPTTRFNVSTNTTIYALGYNGCGGSSPTITGGGTLYARRVR